MTVASGDILRVVAGLLWDDGEINQNVFNAVVTGGGSPWADQDILDDAEAWADNMYANIVGNLSEDISGNTITVYKYDAIDDDWDEVGTNAWGFSPTSVSEYLPRGVAALLLLGTTDPDVQGKKYIPALVEGIVADGLIGATMLTNMLAFGADWLTAFVGGTSGATWTPGVWSVKNTVFKAAVSSVLASAIPAYQRRRKNNVGI